ncbi:MAG: DUF2384 domain-containing protein [Gammaproteobacteria bacterium]|nr:DUF2384 domain-containing protein [Gammaproteobacteria bacterium]
MPDSPEINERADHLLGIAGAPRASWSHNAHMGAIWMNRPNHRFDGRKPLAVLIEDGLPGFFAIRTTSTAPTTGTSAVPRHRDASVGPGPRPAMLFRLGFFVAVGPGKMNAAVNPTPGGSPCGV